MARTYHKLDFYQREKVWELRSKGMSGAEVARLLKVGFPREDPPITSVKITAQAVNSVYRTQCLQRNALYAEQMATIPTGAVMLRNRRQLSMIAAAELERLRQKQADGKLDPEQLRKLAGAVERIEKLELNAAKRGAVPDEPPSKGRDQGDLGDIKVPPSFADQMLADAARRERESTSDAGQEVPVPTDLKAKDTAMPTGVS
jgi:hypothetical protein